MYEAGDVRVEDVPDAHLIEPTDALVRVTRAAICGSDLWPYKSMPHDDAGRRMGHDFIGTVEAVGSDVQDAHSGRVWRREKRGLEDHALLGHCGRAYVGCRRDSERAAPVDEMTLPREEPRHGPRNDRSRWLRAEEQ
jgi:hypothetical protein